MSSNAVKWVLGGNASVPGKLLSMLYVLAWYADSEGKNVRPTVRTLATAIQKDERSVQRYLRELEELKVIGRMEGEDFSTRADRRATVYEIYGVTENALRGDKTSSEGSYGVTKTALRGDTTCHPNRKNRRHIYLIEKNSNNSIDSSSEFEKFWNNYPRKMKKAKALAVWDRKVAVDGELVTEAIEAAKNYADRVVRESTDAKYVCSPARWLEEERWIDYPVEYVKELNIIHS